MRLTDYLPTDFYLFLPSLTVYPSSFLTFGLWLYRASLPIAPKYSFVLPLLVVHLSYYYYLGYLPPIHPLLFPSPAPERRRRRRRRRRRPTCDNSTIGPATSHLPFGRSPF
ncbi:uncharacterized protein LY79DRAFT_47212 [Colletotrichum navitas]|uniref:Uncharacterized protein n=1 Tax=Colletotrichum navitas TaxID=681940 RepID=A0AAD8Q6H4_9PEZI|nr:uncharacterized protein LY79DRAFT_47212 [Colletotrichum navitas]KAK1596514.1 hypothetical protein LY79DRAFT_47212 [Colletotrichum navitas]